MLVVCRVHLVVLETSVNPVLLALLVPSVRLVLLDPLYVVGL